LAPLRAGGRPALSAWTLLVRRTVLRHARPLRILAGTRRTAGLLRTHRLRRQRARSAHRHLRGTRRRRTRHARRAGARRRRTRRGDTGLTGGAARGGTRGLRDRRTFL